MSKADQAIAVPACETAAAFLAATAERAARMIMIKVNRPVSLWLQRIAAEVAPAVLRFPQGVEQRAKVDPPVLPIQMCVGILGAPRGNPGGHFFSMLLVPASLTFPLSLYPLRIGLHLCVAPLSLSAILLCATTLDRPGFVRVRFCPLPVPLVYALPVLMVVEALVALL